LLKNGQAAASNTDGEFLALRACWMLLLLVPIIWRDEIRTLPFLKSSM